jgi:hypothetical protein
MADGDDTWDLSDNDIAAIKYVLAENERLRKELATAREDSHKAGHAEAISLIQKWWDAGDFVDPMADAILKDAKKMFGPEAES